MAMLSDQELLRYSRQILLPQIDVDGQLRLKQARALIVGLGGLGSPVSLYLAAAGVGELHLADFDTVDMTNLQRQIVHDSQSVGRSKVDSAMARLAALNPEVCLVPHTWCWTAPTISPPAKRSTPLAWPPASRWCPAPPSASKASFRCSIHGARKAPVTTASTAMAAKPS
ncbi:Molybdopterin-synthase adenylyltransferase [compost metagenome]